ncbi:hypothetical protein KL86PLE_130165 [uncultured Pleomorphomonas sp.]|uniref:Uncharacterized protein n=1 Tax=uncultured Pleomorphomonas sp. TaxID=442121 RepID=A0A212L9U1_9HYPH|nr:hypothetical protein KL86PLE_130165 [uncultured Pleomorphomonas sp.]
MQDEGKPGLVDDDGRVFPAHPLALPLVALRPVGEVFRYFQAVDVDVDQCKAVFEALPVAVAADRRLGGLADDAGLLHRLDGGGLAVALALHAPALGDQRPMGVARGNEQHRHVATRCPSKRQRGDLMLDLSLGDALTHGDSTANRAESPTQCDLTRISLKSFQSVEKRNLRSRRIKGIST